MYIRYEDITDRITGTPRWWLDGVPRYCAFSPDQVGVYAKEAALLLVEGQNPQGLFEVGVFAPSIDFRFGFRSHLLAYGDIFTGDPPNYKNRATPHMSTDTVRILQYWKMGDRFTWHRDSSLEMQLRERDSENSLLPNYVRLAREEAGQEWEAALIARDAAKIRALLADVNCPSSEEVARLLLLEAVRAQHRRELNDIWTENGGR